MSNKAAAVSAAHKENVDFVVVGDDVVVVFPFHKLSMQ